MRIRDNVAWTATELRVVAMDLNRPGASPYVLETTAAAVWEEIATEGALSVDTLLHNLTQAFGAEQTDIRPDLETLLADLVARDLIMTVSAEGEK